MEIKHITSYTCWSCVYYTSIPNWERSWCGVVWVGPIKSIRKQNWDVCTVSMWISSTIDGMSFDWFNQLHGVYTTHFNAIIPFIYHNLIHDTIHFRSSRSALNFVSFLWATTPPPYPIIVDTIVPLLNHRNNGCVFYFWPPFDVVYLSSARSLRCSCAIPDRNNPLCETHTIRVRKVIKWLSQSTTPT